MPVHRPRSPSDGHPSKRHQVSRARPAAAQTARRGSVELDGAARVDALPDAEIVAQVRAVDAVALHRDDAVVDLAGGVAHAAEKAHELLGQVGRA